MAKVRDVWRDLVLTLREHHLSGPTREARLMLADVLSTSPSHIYLFWDQDLAQEKMEKLYLMLEERFNGVPLQYVLGEWEFFSLSFDIRKGVFIPRLDTESWLEEAIITLRARFNHDQGIICDLGCGSGVIGLTTAYWIPGIQVYAIDISRPAVDMTLHNAGKLGIDSRVIVELSDLFQDFASSSTIQFDAILSNPPYVKEEEWFTLSPDIRLHEPKDALVSGSDGLDLIRRILNDSSSYLKKEGFLYLEHDPSQVEAIAEIASPTPLRWDHIISDYQGQPRATVFIRR